MRTRILSAASIGFYLWLCFSWFDHDIDMFLADTPPILPAILFGTSLLVRGLPKLNSEYFIVFGVVFVSLLTRLLFVSGAYGLFSSDAAAQGLMALHIVEGKHHPIFLYNWSYIGSIKAHLAAFIAFIIGDPVKSFAAAAAVNYAAFTGAVYLLARTVVTRAEALLAASFVIIAPGFLTAWGMSNEGNYVDVMLFGTLMLWLCACWMRSDSCGSYYWFWIGVLGGLAFWTHVLATYYLLTVFLVMVLFRFGPQLVKRFVCFAGGFIVGDFPGILWNWDHDWLSFRWWSLDAEAMELSERVIRTLVQLKQVFTTSLAVLSGYGDVESFWLPSLWHFLLTLFIPGVAIFFAWRKRKKLLKVAPESMLLSFVFLVVMVFAQSSFGWMTHQPRYLLFMFSVVPIFVGTTAVSLWNWKKSLAVVFMLALLLVNIRGSVGYLLVALESDRVNRSFISKLEKLGIRYVRSDYHLSYKYVFLSHGRMVWTSELGPSQTEWYLPFRQELEGASKVALVPRSYRHARRIVKRLEARGIDYRRENLLYPVLFEFTEMIHPSQLR